MYWAYRTGKTKWRRFSKKPTRRVRRFAKRKGGKGKGGKHASAFMATDEVQTYFKDIVPKQCFRDSTWGRWVGRNSVSYLEASQDGEIFEIKQEVSDYNKAMMIDDYNADEPITIKVGFFW